MAAEALKSCANCVSAQDFKQCHVGTSKAETAGECYGTYCK